MNLVKNKIKGSVLGFTVYILICITIIMSLIFMHYSLVLYNATSLIKNEIMYKDIENAISFFLYDLDDHYDIEDITKNQSSDLETVNFQWGFLEVCGVKVNGGQNYNKVAFLGFDIEDSTILYVPENYSSLTLSGESSLTGNICISSKGLKRGNINGFKNTSGTNLIQGKVNVSETRFPDVIKESSSVLDSMNSLCAKSYTRIIKSIQLLDSSNLSNSFLDRLLIISDEIPIILSNVYLSGYIIVKSTKSVIIEKDAVLEDIIIQAPYIHIKSGFSGSIQCIASDSIIIQENCQLSYPSVCALMDEKNDHKLNKIIIQGKSEITGLIFSNSYKKENSFITFAEDVTIKGQVYTTGLIDSQINLEGAAILGRPIAITSSGFHENYLLNTKIKMNSGLHFTNLLRSINTTKSRSIIKWIN